MQNWTKPDPDSEFYAGFEGEKLPQNITKMLLLLHVRMRLLPRFYDVDPHMSDIPCSLYSSILKRNEGSTEEPFKAVTTTNGCNVLLLLLLLLLRCLEPR